MLRSKVLLPSDGSDTALKAAAYAAKLMKINHGMKLAVLVVVPQFSGLSGTQGPTKDALVQVDREMEVKAKEVLEKTVQVFAGEGLSVDEVIVKGDPAGMIIEYAEQGHYDHIIMGSRGVSELKGVALGSVSHKVIHLASSRVTLVK